MLVLYSIFGELEVLLQDFVNVILGRKMGVRGLKKLEKVKKSEGDLRISIADFRFLVDFLAHFEIGFVFSRCAGCVVRIASR